MNFIKVKTYEELSKIAADIIGEVVVNKPDCVLGLATGSSPVGTYKKLAEKCAKGELDFSKVRTVNLDEYLGLSPENDQSYRYFMNDNLFNHVNIDKANTHVPGGTGDPDEECKKYDAIIESMGGIDLQLLGIGRNGHIGFNEPDSKLISGTHVVELTPNTIAANSRFFASAGDVPKKALTMGIGSIFKSRKIIIMANGAEKKYAVGRMLENAIDTSCPATLLNLHEDVTLICTEDAI